MPIQINDKVYRAMFSYVTCVSAMLMLMLMTACGGGTSNTASSQIDSGITIMNVNNGAVITPGSSVYGETEIAIAGVELFGAKVNFNSKEGPNEALTPDLSNPSQYWLPNVVKKTTGNLFIVTSDGRQSAVPLTVIPYQTFGTPGVAIKSFLQTALTTINNAIDTAKSTKPPAPQEVVALLKTQRFLVQKQLAWVSSVMQVGSVVIANRSDGTPVIMTVRDLQTLDEEVLSTGALATNRSMNSAFLLPIEKFMDWLIPSAFAQSNACLQMVDLSAIDLTASCQAEVQTNDLNVFANRENAIGQGLNRANDILFNMANTGATNNFSSASVGYNSEIALYAAY